MLPITWDRRKDPLYRSNKILKEKDNDTETRKFLSNWRVSEWTYPFHQKPEKPPTWVLRFRYICPYMVPWLGVKPYYLAAAYLLICARYTWRIPCRPVKPGTANYGLLPIFVFLSHKFRNIFNLIKLIACLFPQIWSLP